MLYYICLLNLSQIQCIYWWVWIWFNIYCVTRLLFSLCIHWVDYSHIISILIDYSYVIIYQVLLLSQFSSVFNYSELIKTSAVLFYLLTEEIVTSAVLSAEEFNIMISDCEVLMFSSYISLYSLLRDIEMFRLSETSIYKINFNCLNTLISLIIQCVNLLLLLLSLILMSVIIIKLSYVCISSMLSQFISCVNLSLSVTTRFRIMISISFS